MTCADDPGMRHETRVAQRVYVGPAERRRASAAGFAENQFLVPDIAGEHVLLGVDLEIAPREIRPPLVRRRHVAFERRVDLRLSGVDRLGLGLGGPGEREEEVKTILDNRSAQ